MTELEILKRAKMYIDKMANGIDPLSDSPVPDSDCINQIRISRCLFYVSDVLRKVIENGGNIEKPSKTKKANFAITEEELKHYIIEEKPIPISEIANKINALVDLNTMNRFKYSCITSFLLNNGFLEEKEIADGKKTKVPTEYGNSIGIFREERQGQYGTYYITVYNAEAQQFILDHLVAIMEMNNSQK